MKKHGVTLNVYYLVKEANLKGLHDVWFQLYDILLITELKKQLKKKRQ